MFDLNGPWLLGALALTFLVGVFASRYIKDVLKGVPSSLRSALNATETNALAALKAAEQKAIADVTGLLPASKATAAAPAATAAAPVAAAPTAASSGILKTVESDASVVVADVKKAV